MLYPLTFRAILKERVWGGRKLQELYGKPLPIGVPIGESWEISDRPGDTSVIANGPLAGEDLHWIVENHREQLLGSAKLLQGRFPLLVKILDAQQNLSLQVHPPASVAGGLKGEPKTEMWYIADARPDAELYVGLKRGVTRSEFERRIQSGGVAETFHRVKVHAGDVMFLPSGRVHAIGSGLVLFEIQQNSDTTYRVYDWDRVGLDGKPRQLHVSESLASIDFNDFEPALAHGESLGGEPQPARRLVSDPLFTVDVVDATPLAAWHSASGAMQILGLLAGRLQVSGGNERVILGPGQFCLVPAEIQVSLVTGETGAKLLRTYAGT